MEFLNVIGLERSLASAASGNNFGYGFFRSRCSILDSRGGSSII
jgi:hypothetical protein